MYSLHRVFLVPVILVTLVSVLVSNHNRPAIANVALKTSPQGDALVGVKLGGATSECHAVAVLGVQFKGALVYGRSADVTKLLRDVALNKSLPISCTPPCDCAAVGADCLLSNLSSEVITSAMPPPPPGTVNIVLDSGGGRPPRSKRRSSNGGDSMIRLYETAKKDAQCKTELCASSNGEMSVSASCGDVKLKVTSSGKVSASITSGNMTMTIP